MKQKVFLLLGIIFTILGFCGIIVPLLPATPFLLLAAYSFGKSSQRFLNWLLSNRFCGEYIRNYKEKNGMWIKNKIYTITVLWLSISSSAIFAVDKLWIRIILFVIALSVTTHILKIKTLRKEKVKIKKR
ncbi:MAG: YbaN family protein [Candidatus Cloacimonetes bacterium]|nr:YbaN family protein [Candidatus Cloacimonadota bacterium]